MASERFIIHGDLGAATFLPWVERHLRRLGLTGRLGATDARCVVLDMEGPPDLIDAMELGVSLGPIEAWVDSIDRHALNDPPKG